MLVAHGVAELNTKPKTLIPVKSHFMFCFFHHLVVTCNKIIDMLKNEQTSYCMNWAINLSLDDLS